MNRLEVVEQVITCERCELHAQCSGPVPMRGEPARIAVVGEAPGETEDLQGSPFIGPAGKLLQELLDEFDFPPVGILNSVSCFPHGTPTWEHLGACESNKWAQINYFNPEYLLLLGAVALKGMRPDLGVKRGRARPFKHQGRVCFATYHPAAALRHSQYEDAMRADLEIFRALIDSGRDGWMKYIPHTCSGCANGADWFESDVGLGWCQIHLPDSERGLYEARQRLLATELEAARRREQQRTVDALHDLPAGGGYVGADHPATSEHAAATVKAGTQEAHLLMLIAAAGTNGLTCYEATQDPSWAQVRPNIAENQVAARRLRLHELGYVTCAETPEGDVVRRATKTSVAQVHVATPAGFVEVDRLRGLVER